MYGIHPLAVSQGEIIFQPLTGYTMRAVQPAKNYDVVSFARAMNDDFGSRVKELFDPEREAALAAQETGQRLLSCCIYCLSLGVFVSLVCYISFNRQIECSMFRQNADFFSRNIDQDYENVY
jgi:hypothetical protein